MLNKEEIEKSKNRLNKILEEWQKILNIKDPIEREIESNLYMEEMPFKNIKTMLNYIDQLETNNKKLIEKLEKDIKKSNKENNPYEEFNKESRMCWINIGKIQLAEEILKIVKGENN